MIKHWTNLKAKPELFAAWKELQQAGVDRFHADEVRRDIYIYIYIYNAFFFSSTTEYLTHFILLSLSLSLSL